MTSQALQCVSTTWSCLEEIRPRDHSILTKHRSPAVVTAVAFLASMANSLNFQSLNPVNLTLLWS